jgi:hypothetical protein
MGLMQQARADLLQIVSNEKEWGIPVVFSAPDNKTVTATCLVKKHHLSINGDGVPVNGKNATISVAEASLTALTYPIRNAAGEVNLNGHKVAWPDSTGKVSSYMIREWFPDETLGLIVCILDDFR